MSKSEMVRSNREGVSRASGSADEAEEDVIRGDDGGVYPRSEVSRSADGELVHEPTGIVVREDRIDRGPEWRSFDDDDSNRRRVGRPRSELLHHRGMTTQIGQQDRDSAGNQLSRRQRDRAGRLRMWQRRMETRDHGERNLRHAFGEIQRMACALGIPKPTREVATVTYRRAHSEGLLPGRTTEAVAAACLYAAAKMEGIPRSLDEIANVARDERLPIARAYSAVKRELGLEVEPTRPEEYLPRLCSEADVSRDHETVAKELIQEARETDGVLVAGKHPVAMAAAALYGAAVALGTVRQQVTQAGLSEVADVSDNSIRARYRQLAEASERDLPLVLG